MLLVTLNNLVRCIYHFVHLHLHSGEHITLAFAHLHVVHSPLHLHLINSLHVLDTSGIVIHVGSHDSPILVHANSCGEGRSGCGSRQVVQTLAW